jgi:hypothetical protein
MYPDELSHLLISKQQHMSHDCSSPSNSLNTIVDYWMFDNKQFVAWLPTINNSIIGSALVLEDRLITSLC